MTKSGRLSNGSLVMTDFQESGRGQQGNVWVSEKEKNLLFTVVLKPENFVPADQYLLNVMTAVAIQQTLQRVLPDALVEIKWPNDVYVNDSKIAGILIETTIANGRLETIFCGIGLNVNQAHFSLSSATSLFIESGKSHDRDSLLEELLVELEKMYHWVLHRPSELLDTYKRHLRWFNEHRTFLIDGKETLGCIKGIDNQGKLILEMPDETRHFSLKEIVFLH